MSSQDDEPSPPHVLIGVLSAPRLKSGNTSQQRQTEWLNPTTPPTRRLNPYTLGRSVAIYVNKGSHQQERTGARTASGYVDDTSSHIIIYQYHSSHLGRVESQAYT